MLKQIQNLTYAAFLAGFACLSNELRPPAPSLSAPPLTTYQPQHAVPPAVAWSETAAVLVDTNCQQQQQQQQQVFHDGQQDVGSDQGQQQQQHQQHQQHQLQLQALQQCWGQQHLGNLPGPQRQLGGLCLQQQQSVGQANAHTSTMQQQHQEVVQCFDGDTCTGAYLQRGQEADEEEMRLFSCAGRVEEDLDAYATLVHSAQSR